MNCEYCGENKAIKCNNQGDKICPSCEKDSSIKCNFCDNVADNKSQIHNNIYICSSNKCKDNYLESYCIENILN